MFRNAADDGQLARAVARKTVGTGLKSPFVAYRIGKFLIKATAFWSAIQVWNWTRFPDEEQDLPEEVRTRPHVVLGRNKEGEVIYFSRIGALGDLLEWFGLDAAPQYIDRWFKGKMTLKDIAKDMAQQPVNIIIQGGVPFIKLAGELITRRALFPNVFEPRTVRDRGLHFARSFGLENEYLALSEKPSRPYRKTIPLFFAYKSDPFASAYYGILREKHDFLKKINKAGEGFWISPRGNALYNARLALRYKDQAAATKYMADYFRMGGTPQGVMQSIRNMHPLSGLSEESKEGKPSERDQFIKTLSGDDRVKALKAYIFYAELASAGQIDRKEFEQFVKDFKAEIETGKPPPKSIAAGAK
jgi:hypothetical protein